mgnify:CR=1 FL=1
MIIASMCGLNVEEIEVKQNSDLDKQLIKKSLGSYPMLEDGDTIINDTHAIAAHICRSAGKDAMLGSNDFA